MTIREGGEVTRWGFIPPNSLQFELSSIEGRVGAVVDQTSDPPTPRFDQPEVAEAVRWYTDLFLKEEVVPYFDPSDEEEESLVSEEQALVEGGQAVMWNDWSATWALRKQQGNRGIVPYPVDAPESGTTLIVTLGPWMSSGTAVVRRSVRASGTASL